MATAYIETTISSLYTGRPAQRLIEAARQNLTKVWWDEYRQEFDLVCSQTVLDECSEGDFDMAEKRRELLVGIPLLELTDDVRSIATLLLSKQIIPAKGLARYYLIKNALSRRPAPRQISPCVVGYSRGN